MSRNFSVSRSGKTVAVSADLILEFITFDERYECDRQRIEAKNAIPLALNEAVERISEKHTLYTFKTEAAASMLYVLYSILLPKVYV